MDKNTLSNRSKLQSYHDLMLHRIHEILIVSSPYDAFIIEQDGRLTEQILNEYLGLHLGYAPRAWRASTATDAMEILSKRKFDLVITMLRIYDMDPISFGSQVKKMYPHIPVVLLAYDVAELKYLPEIIPVTSIDKVFIWNGNANVFPAIIKYIEDTKNIDRDIRIGDVRAIIVVENSPHYYSIILPQIYSEIIYHTRHLMDKSLNDAHRMLRLRARPKIILVGTYEEAEKYFKQYQMNILGVISDIRFMRGGKENKSAGFELATWIRSIDPAVPILLQSSDETSTEKAQELRVDFLNKKSETLLQELRQFIVNNFGFGDFVFRFPDGKEIARASNLIELKDTLSQVPDESLLYHASKNHFSNWIAARSEFWLASELRPQQIQDFSSTDDLREYLAEAIERAKTIQRRGRIIESHRGDFDPEATLIRIRGGSFGGKARGLAYVNSLFSKTNIDEKFPDIIIRIPRSVVIGTNEFDDFMGQNDFWDFALRTADNNKIRKRFLEGNLSEKLVEFLKQFLQKVNYPIAVRSSSLFEDSQYQSLAGMYSTYMLSNCSEDFEKRLKNLCDAIKLVYASTFFTEVKSVMESSIRRQEDEKMGIVIQELVGECYDGKFYPTFSGVTKSINCYPVSYMKRDEGVTYVSLGLGKMVVEGGKALIFSPKYPSILPQFYSPKAILENSQFQFYALTMDCDEHIDRIIEDENLSLYDLADAEEDGTLQHVGSVLTKQDNIVRDSLNYEGTRVVTFSNILKWKMFPLADILSELLDIGEQAMGCPVDIEFSVNMSSNPSIPHEFCFLQIRPMAFDHYSRNLRRELIRDEDIFCRSELSLGDGIIEDIQDIIYVKPERFNVSKTQQIAREIANFNKNIGKKSPYLLIGPGRWGSVDSWLGIPVRWNQISGAKVIVEVGLEDLNIDLSFGSHFFQNVTSLRVGYLTINHRSKMDFINWDWLREQTVSEQTSFVRWVRLDSPITINIDGRTGYGVGVKPLLPQPEIMDEQESPGI